MYLNDVKGFRKKVNRINPYEEIILDETSPLIDFYDSFRNRDYRPEIVAVANSKPYKQDFQIAYEKLEGRVRHNYQKLRFNVKDVENFWSFIQNQAKIQKDKFDEWFAGIFFTLAINELRSRNVDDVITVNSVDLPRFCYVGNISNVHVNGAVTEKDCMRFAAKINNVVWDGPIKAKNCAQQVKNVGYFEVNGPIEEKNFMQNVKNLENGILNGAIAGENCLQYLAREGRVGVVRVNSHVNAPNFMSDAVTFGGEAGIIYVLCVGKEAKNCMSNLASWGSYVDSLTIGNILANKCLYHAASSYCPFESKSRKSRIKTICFPGVIYGDDVLCEAADGGIIDKILVHGALWGERFGQMIFRHGKVHEVDFQGSVNAPFFLNGGTIPKLVLHGKEMFGVTPERLEKLLYSE